MELRARALQVLCMPDPGSKAAAARELASCAASLAIAPAAPAPTLPVPGRPARPELIHPARVARRSPSKPEGLAALLHAIAHIEFNAINLALDAAWRFDGMPPEFYLAWTQVAGEEAYHFTLLREHLSSLGYAYGDFAAHDGLWAMCEKTKDDIVARMALVPRTLEARGLDATPQIQDKLRQVNTAASMRAVAILDVILHDEVGHVAIGNHWYKWLCDREGLDPVALYPQLAEQYAAPKLHPPFNEEARRRAGFSDDEIAWLSSTG
ncbi:MAG TPA: ferritin-like domain-containing protein [Ramlibacter sp.]|nr:ferritin-like domain-containing protein [Ramlibacter sp.]